MKICSLSASLLGLSLVNSVTPAATSSSSSLSPSESSSIASIVSNSLPSSNSPSAFVIGVYNVSFFRIDLPESSVQQILPSKYRDSILEKNPDGTVKVILEAGHQSMNGPPGLQVLNNEEAKLEVPGIQRLQDDETSFTYKSHIFVNNLIASLFGYLAFGLHDTFEIIRPKDSSKAETYDYSVKNYMDISNVRISEEKKGTTGFEKIQNGPWFADGPLCGRHQYENSEFEYLLADVTLYPKILKQSSKSQPLFFKDVEGVHFVSNFTIFGPAKCESFAS